MEFKFYADPIFIGYMVTAVIFVIALYKSVSAMIENTEKNARMDKDAAMARRKKGHVR